MACSEITCNAYTFGDGQVPGEGSVYTPCYENIQLRTRTNQTCEVKCEEGWLGGSGLVTCPFDATFGTWCSSAKRENVSCSINHYTYSYRIHHSELHSYHSRAIIPLECYGILKLALRARTQVLPQQRH